MGKSYKLQLDFGEDVINTILESVKKVATDILTEFGEETVQQLVVLARSEVYGVYDPEYYIRRHTLINPSSYDVSIDKENMKVIITPVAEFNRAHGGWNYGNELGGFMNYGNRWHGYVINYNVPMPRPYLYSYVEGNESWNNLYSKLKTVLGDWIDVVDIRISLGDD